MNNWINFKTWLLMSALVAFVEYGKASDNENYLNQYGFLTIALQIILGGFFWGVIFTFIFNKIKGK